MGSGIVVCKLKQGLWCFFVLWCFVFRSLVFCFSFFVVFSSLNDNDLACQKILTLL